MNPQSVSSEILLGAWAASLLSLFIYSFLYKDNPLFKLAEHIFVGVSVGYVLTITYHEVMLKKLYVPLVEQGDWLLADRRRAGPVHAGAAGAGLGLAEPDCVCLYPGHQLGGGHPQISVLVLSCNRSRAPSPRWCRSDPAAGRLVWPS